MVSEEPFRISIYNILDGAHWGFTVILPFKCATAFDLNGLPSEICLDIRDIILNHVSPNKPELTCGKPTVPKKRNTLWHPYPIEQAQRKRNICEALVPLKMPFLLSPRLFNRAYFGKHFKSASTTDLASFLKGIGPVSRRMLRGLIICAYHSTSAMQACKWLADATNLETLHFTAICVAEAGCRRNHKRYSLDSHDGKEFLYHFRDAISRQSLYSGRRLSAVLCQRPILRFDADIVGYGASFDSYLQDQPVYQFSMSQSDASVFRTFWAQAGIPLQE